MKFLHLADLHIGKTMNGFSLIDDQRHALEQVLHAIAPKPSQQTPESAPSAGTAVRSGADEAAQVDTNEAAQPGAQANTSAHNAQAPAQPLEQGSANNVDALLICGDLYDKASPSTEAVALLDWFFTQVAALKVPCLVIPGNHDSTERVAYLSGVLGSSGIHIAGPYNGALKHVQLEDEHGPVTFWLLPFMRPAIVRRHFPEEGIGTSYTLAVKAALEHEHIDFSQRNVVLAHQFVSFGVQKPETSDSEIGSVGGLDEVSSAVLEGFDYVALGHIHKSQSIGAPHMRYAGSLLKYSFSEAHYQKEFPLVTLGAKGDISLEGLTVRPLHEVREIEGPLEALIAPEIAAAPDNNDYLHVTLTNEHPQIDALTRLRTVYPNVMALDYRNMLDRAKSAAGAPPSPAARSFDPAQLFAEFYEAQYGSALTPLQLQTANDALDAALKEGGTR